MPKPGTPILMAVIGAAHGIKGEVRVKTFTSEPLALGDYRLLFTRMDGPSRSSTSGQPSHGGRSLQGRRTAAPPRR